MSISPQYVGSQRWTGGGPLPDVVFTAPARASSPFLLPCLSFAMVGPSVDARALRPAREKMMIRRRAAIALKQSPSRQNSVHLAAETDGDLPSRPACRGGKGVATCSATV